MSALIVRVHDVEVGTLEVFDNYSHRFTFSPDYVALSVSQRPVLGQIFEDRRPFPIDTAGPMCWFSHLLPQGVMRNWRARLLNIDNDDEFELLQFLGEDMPGAVTLLPGTSPVARPKKSIDPAQHKGSDPRFKFSLAGAQWKLSARSSGRGLTTAAASGGKAYIAKFDAPEYPDLPQCEFATMTWARKAGISLPDFELRAIADFDELPDQMPTGSGQVFVIERFDRCEEHGRIHIEDFGQILDRPPGQRQYQGAYEDIARVIHWICPEDAAEFLRLLAFCTISGNGDAHLKNFSVIYRDHCNPRLSPAYDLVSTVGFFPSGREDLTLSLDGTKKFADIQLSAFQSLCCLMDLSWDEGRSIVLDTVGRAIDAWESADIQSEYPARFRQHLTNHLSSLPL